MNRDTICVQGGYTPGNGEPRQIPIIQSTTFKYATSEDMGKLFDLEADGYFYSRLQNPTCDLVAKKICELEGGAAAMLTSSGQAANFFALFNICNNGDHIVASSAIYGGTFNLINVTMRKMGVECTFVSPDCTEEELMLLNAPEERELIRHLSALTDEIITAAKDYDPARITRYAVTLATLFHKFYNACRVGVDDEKLRAARLYLCCRVKDVMGIILTEFKITVPESM